MSCTSSRSRQGLGQGLPVPAPGSVLECLLPSLAGLVQGLPGPGPGSGPGSAWTWTRVWGGVCLDLDQGLGQGLPGPGPGSGAGSACTWTRVWGRVCPSRKQGLVQGLPLLEAGSGAALGSSILMQTQARMRAHVRTHTRRHCGYSVALCNSMWYYRCLWLAPASRSHKSECARDFKYLRL